LRRRHGVDLLALYLPDVSYEQETGRSIESKPPRIAKNLRP
jgi:hypothetical protein